MNYEDKTLIDQKKNVVNQFIDTRNFDKQPIIA